MKKFALLLCLSFCVHAHTAAQERVPGVVVNHLPAESGKYIGSPSIAVLPDGTYMVSHDEFGPQSSEFTSARTAIFTSQDQGKSWKWVAVVDGQFWSSLFHHRGALYLMGTSRHHGNVVIRRSRDGGLSWTVPYSPSTGLLLEGEYHTAPTPVLYQAGRIWRGVEYATAPTTRWGQRYSALMLSVPLDADLLDARRWQKSQALPYDARYLDGKFNGWLEGNAVADKQGRVGLVLRVDVPARIPEQAAFVEISRDGKSASFDARRGFRPMPGASKKFTIRYDERSARHWALVNLVPPELQGEPPATVRNTVALVSTGDLVNWQVHKQVLAHPDRQKHGFQYVDWVIDKDDIVFVARTAFDDGKGGAPNFHDANFLTFHRVENFRQAGQESPLR